MSIFLTKETPQALQFCLAQLKKLTIERECGTNKHGYVMSQVENVEEYVSQLKVVELREELKKRHLSYAGNKKDLAQRLQDTMLKEKEDTAPAETEV